jgi:hypothetical protein
MARYLGYLVIPDQWSFRRARVYAIICFEYTQNRNGNRATPLRALGRLFRKRSTVTVGRPLFSKKHRDFNVSRLFTITTAIELISRDLAFAFKLYSFVAEEIGQASRAQVYYKLDNNCAGRYRCSSITRAIARLTDEFNKSQIRATYRTRSSVLLSLSFCEEVAPSDKLFQQGPTGR